MKPYIYLFFVALYYYPLLAQDSTTVQNYKLGTATIKISDRCFDPCQSKISFLNVHENESTSVEAAEALLVDSGGKLMVLKHTGKRYISFYLGRKRFFFDPNRIYTQSGIRESLKRLSHYDAKAASVVDGFAKHILRNYVDGKNLVVALHNNTDSNYSIKSYVDNGDEAVNAAAVFINEEMDEDDFIVTTDSTLYEKIRELNINVILQDNARVVDDGSLSVYAARQNIPYINIEAQAGHYEEQLAMMKAIHQIIQAFAYTKNE